MQTAEEFLKDKFKQIYYNQPEGLTSKIPESRYLDLHVTGRIDGVEQNYPEMMIEFAKLHVEAALKAASESAMFSYEGARGRIHHNAYPLINIK